MTKQQRISKAAREAITDTAIGTALNAPINYGIIAVAFTLELSALTTSLVCTGIFTVVAILRKTAVRLHFAKKQEAV